MSEQLDPSVSAPTSVGVPSGSPTPAVATSPVQAVISGQWSWATSAARIPQISALTFSLSEPIEHARLTVVVQDDDLLFGSKTVHDGPLPRGPFSIGAIHVPLSARLMSRVLDRQSAACTITVEDGTTGRALTQLSEAVDLQPRDLWLWRGDPARVEQQVKIRNELAAVEEELEKGPENPHLQLAHAALSRQLHDGESRGRVLAHSLLASFVRPNHPDIASVAREAAAHLERATGDASFTGFQHPDADVSARHTDAAVDAIYAALQARNIAYSEPPPGWDYVTTGQRIRDHGDVARGGLGTCLDTTVLAAAVMEQAGLLPVLVLVSGHIFIGYWRRDPRPGAAGSPTWYPGKPLVEDSSTFRTLVDGGWLGVIETTSFTAGNSIDAAQARAIARNSVLRNADEVWFRCFIDVTEARVAGVSPLPAVHERSDGITEVIEYRAGSAPSVTQVETAAVDRALAERQTDSHPLRYRTWKSSLFSLSATNALLNLGNSARVQPIIVPPSSLGLLEDRLHQDVSFTLHSGWDVPEVWRAREITDAASLLTATHADDVRLLTDQLDLRRLYVQRTGRPGARTQPTTGAAFARELRAMAHAARTSRDERGMNPLFLCIGMLRWPHKPGVHADAPLILVPVTIAAPRGAGTFTLSLDASQQTTPNAALIEWLRREHGVTIPGLAEPLADRAGIDVDAVLAEVRTAVATRGLPFEVTAEARLAILDLASFRMWQDLNNHADTFLAQPLVRHLVHSPTETFVDPVLDGDGATSAGELDKLETPVPADATQKQAVLWARQGRSFVLQGPPGTGKSQTITNMVAACVTAGMKVLFVAEKGTALTVVQRRLDSIGLGPFTLNLHHEGSNSTEVRAQLRGSLTATVTPDPTAMENARRRLRNAQYELEQYPTRLHETNAAGFSAYSSHDELLVLGEGPSLPVPQAFVTGSSDAVDRLRDLFADLQPWTAAAGVRPGHPWRLAGGGDGEPFDVPLVQRAVLGVLAGTDWANSAVGELRALLAEMVTPAQIDLLAAASHPGLPDGQQLVGVIDSRWATTAIATIESCGRSLAGSAPRLHGFRADVLALNIRAVLDQLKQASDSSIFGRGKRQLAALAPLASYAPHGLDLQPGSAPAILSDLIDAQDMGRHIHATLVAIPGLSSSVSQNVYEPGALERVRHRVDELVGMTRGLRGYDDFTGRVLRLTLDGGLSQHHGVLVSWSSSWQLLWTSLAVHRDDFDAWRGDGGLLATLESVRATWRSQVDDGRLLPLQNWCQLVRRLEPLREAGLVEARADLLEGRIAADAAEEALTRGLAEAALRERLVNAGLERFNSVQHDQRVTTYAEAQARIRTHWVTEGPSHLLEERRSRVSSTGGLARELEKTSRKLGTRAILRKFGSTVQELTPLVLCSPASVVDLIEPGVMEFDVVIFDEASQITVPEAVGSIGRARAAIVVGDSKQMPPTRSVGGGTAEDEEVDDPDSEELVEDQESILSECELASVPRLRLNWHYRSQDESLIAFSNRAYYEGNLSSFPTPTLMSTTTGIEFRHVSGGHYRRAGSERVTVAESVVAGSNTNPVEAVAVVDAITHMVNQGGTLPSIGVVTFNEPQRQLIEDLLHASTDPRIASVMSEATMGRGEALFVKALEQVQGDERDTIVFSVGFSKQANGRIPTNFGPLTNNGGERRLNVAVTRARRKNIVFCSFDPSELDVAGSTYQGPKDLKDFLLFAKASTGTTSASVDVPGRAPVRDRHRDEIASALRAAGLHVLADVGLSTFRIDLVLGRPESPERPLLPVLLDGQTWKARGTVSDRDVLPIEVLTDLMGWPTVARIWWPMWFQNRKDVVSQILALVDDAENQLDKREAAAQHAGDALPTQTPPPSDLETKATGTQEIGTHDLPRMATAPLDELHPAPVTERPSTPPAAPPLTADPAPGGRRSAREGDHSTGAFVPAHTDLVGAVDVLDSLAESWAVDILKEQLLDIVEDEGPVELSRLARIAGRRFGLSAVRASRAAEILRHLPPRRTRSSELGTFVWPADLDPETWAGFRYSGDSGGRAMEAIAPEEIRNAMRAFRTEFPDASPEDVLRRTAEAFGTARLGANVRARLVKVFSDTFPDPPEGSL